MKIKPFTSAEGIRDPLFLYHCWINALGLLILFSSIFCVAELDNIQFSHEFNDDIKVSQVRTIIQDEKGFMWFGGRNGLARYDGHETKIFKHNRDDPTSLSTSYIYDLVVDDTGRLWIATSHGVNLYDASTQKFKRYYGDAQSKEGLGSNYVRSLMLGSNNVLWAGTSHGHLSRYDEKTDSFIRYLSSQDGKTRIGAYPIYAMDEDLTGNIWMALGRNGGLGRYNIRSDQLSYFLHSEGDEHSLSNNEVSYVEVAGDGKVWVGTYGGGISVLNPKTTKFKRYHYDPKNEKGIGSAYIRRIFEDSNSNIWVASDGRGLQRYDPLNDAFVSYSHDRSSSKSIASNVVYDIYEDVGGNLWLSLFLNSIDFLDFKAASFTRLDPSPSEITSLSSRTVLSMSKAKKGKIWVGTEAGLNSVDVNGGGITHYQNDPLNPASLPSNTITALLYDKQHRLWVGTEKSGLCRLTLPGGLCHRYVNFGQKDGLRGRKVREIYQDNNEDIWVGTEDGGLSRYSSKEDRFEFINLSRDTSPTPIWKIVEDFGNKLWLGSTDKLYMLEADRRTSRHFEPAMDEDGSKLKLGRVKSLAIGENGLLWVGSSNSGLSVFNRRSYTFEDRKAKSDIPAEHVYSIVEDARRFLWLGTELGIIRYDPGLGEFVVFDKSHGLPCNSFQQGAHLKLHSGDFLFGCSNGIAKFNPETMHEERDIARVVITDLKILGESVPVGMEGSVLRESIDRVGAITLSQEHSVFTLTYAALSYSVSKRNQYAYRLVGFDQNWHYVGARRSATYTNLDPGEYTFQVKASNNMGAWSRETTDLRIVVLPMWWQTWWSKIVYVLIVGFVILLFTRSEKRKVLIEKERVRHLQEVSVLKDKFLANTSHELRTPLNGIIGLAESLLGGVAGELPNVARKNLATIVTSGNRLSLLVNEILDFSKLDQDSMTLNKEVVNIYAIIELVYSLSRHKIKDDSVFLVSNLPKGLPCVEADPDRVQQILHNLVDNAIKFTKKGYVSVNVAHVGEVLQISVCDTGIGIPADKLEKIFNSFEQLEHSDNREVGGAGLGLSVAEKLVELHDGRLHVVSAENKGSTFTFSLPVSHEKNDGMDYFRKRIRHVEYQDNLNSILNTHESMTPAGECNGENKDRYEILVVDDEPVNRLVLTSYLELEGYSVTTKENARDAMAALEEDHKYDLLLLDVMMPGMSGYEMCEKLRKSYPLYVLPVLFVTAKTQVEDLVRGYEAGGNDFIVKPVCKDELISRVQSHIAFSRVFRYGGQEEVQ